jgi:hypothetical protein
MVYKYFPNINYEDFSSGRVIYHKPNYPNYPVRLVGEIFSRCLVYLEKKNRICIYDPCCGGAYIVTVLGYLFNEIIDTIYCSDISREAIGLSQRNISLLSYYGMKNRKDELNELLNNFGKESHKNAINSLEKIEKLIKHEIQNNAFEANILNKKDFADKEFIADIIITDVPYGNLVNWSGNSGDEINELLNGIAPVINLNTVIAISHNKKQKINNCKFHIVEKMNVGHRKIDIIKPGA